MRTVIVALLTALGFAPQVAAQSSAAPPLYRGRIVGVFDDQTGEPIAGAEVRNVANGLSALTTATGTLSLFFVDTSGGVLSIRKVGYEPRMIAATNSPRDTVPLTIVLSRTAQALPAVVTKAKNADAVVPYRTGLLRGFEERRHQGFGHFVSEADLRKLDPMGTPLAEVIASRVAGAKIIQGPTGKNLIGQRSAGRPIDPCFASVFLDGNLIYAKERFGDRPIDFQALRVTEYAGIEFYSGGSTVPAQFSSADRGCGIMLLWTRER